MLLKTVAFAILLLSSLAPLGLAENPSCSCSPKSTTTTSDEPSNTGTDKPSQNSPASGGPQFVVYSDKWVTNVLPPVEEVKGYTVFALSFLLSTGPADQVQGWEQLDKQTRQQLKKKYNDAGIKVVASVFGGTDEPTTSGKDPVELGNTMAKWVIDYDLDGMDVDYEDFPAMNAMNGKAEEWVIKFTKAVRSKLPKGKYILTHAPVAPWFSKMYTSGAYLAVHKEVGDMIDWYNIQFYNQNEYEDCETLVSKSTNKYPGSSLEEIARSGVPKNKLIIGKPGTAADASNGLMEPSKLATCVQQAKGKGWSGGVMVWQYPNAGAKWIKEVRAKSWPVS